jgi:hypothetical protein
MNLHKTKIITSNSLSILESFDLSSPLLKARRAKLLKKKIAESLDQAYD